MDNKSQVAGILSIVAGAFGVLGLAMAVVMVNFLNFFFQEPFFPGSPGAPQEVFSFMSILCIGWGVFFGLLGGLAIAGGVFALKRRRWGLALAGAIAATLTFFPCGIAAIILVSLAQPEFNGGRPATPLTG